MHPFSVSNSYQELSKEEPKAIIGFFDLSQRCNVPREILTLTMPYSMYMEIENGAADGCLTTTAWEKIQDRYQDE